MYLSLYFISILMLFISFSLFSFMCPSSLDLKRSVEIFPVGFIFFLLYFFLQLDEGLYWWKWYQQMVTEENAYILEYMKTFFPEASQRLCMYFTESVVYFVDSMEWVAPSVTYVTTKTSRASVSGVWLDPFLT